MITRWAQLALAMITVASIVVMPVNGSVERHFSKESGYGYFYGDYYMTPATPLYNTGMTINGTDNLARANDLINTLRNDSASADPAVFRPAAFITQTMLQKPSGSNATSPASSADLTELSDRLIAFISNGGTITLTPYQYSIETYRQPTNDVAWYRTATPMTASAYVFSKGGVDYYAIRASTGNVLSYNDTTQTLPGIPAVASGWTAQGRTELTKTDYRAGETVTFHHYLKNNGPDSANISYRVINTSTGGTVKSEPAKKYLPGEEREVALATDGNPSDTFDIPSGTPAGTTFCRELRWTPASSTSPRESRGTQVCATVVNGWSLTPTVNSSQASALPDTTVTYRFSLQHAGTKADNIRIVKRKIVVPPGVDGSFLTSSHTGWDCSDYMTRGASLCSPTWSSTHSFVPGVSYSIADDSETVTGAPGTRYCRVLSVEPYQNTSPDRLDSAASCVTIGKSPYIALIGADSSAGGSMQEGGINDDAPYNGATLKGQGFIASRYADKGFGSFSDYGLFAVGPIYNFSSSGRVDDASYTRLSFANTDTPANYFSTFGYFQDVHKIPDYAASSSPYASIGSRPTVSGVSDWSVSGEYNITTNGNVTLDPQGHTMSPRQRIIIYAPNASITIQSPISYQTTGLPSFADAPRLLIIAKNIAVSGRVSKLDGVFFASNVFNSCAEAGNDLGSNQMKQAITLNGECKNQLVINGAVISYKTLLPRTYGGLDPGKPSEMIRMRPETFIQPYVDSASNSGMTTDYETELPPRY